MAVADTLRIELVWQLQGVDFAVNVLHYTTGSTDPLVQNDADQLAIDIGTAFATANVDDGYANETDLNRIILRDLRTDGNPPLIGAVTFTGGFAGAPMPGQNCVVSTLRTTNGSRRGRGRIYWPAPSADVLTDGGNLSSTYVSRYNALVTDLMSIDATNIGVINLGVYSRADDVTRTVTAVTTDNVFDVQTRRRDQSIV